VADNSSFMDKLGAFLGGGTSQNTVNGINGPVNTAAGNANDTTMRPSTGQSVLAGLATLYGGNQAANSLSNVKSNATTQNDALLAQQAALKAQLDRCLLLLLCMDKIVPMQNSYRETLARKVLPQAAIVNMVLVRSTFKPS